MIPRRAVSSCLKTIRRRPPAIDPDSIAGRLSLVEERLKTMSTELDSLKAMSIGHGSLKATSTDLDSLKATPTGHGSLGTRTGHAAVAGPGSGISRPPLNSAWPLR